MALGTTIENLREASTSAPPLVADAYRQVAVAVGKPAELVEAAHKAVAALAPAKEAATAVQLHAAQAILVATLRWLEEQPGEPGAARWRADLLERLLSMRQRALGALAEAAAAPSTLEPVLGLAEEVGRLHAGVREVPAWLAGLWARQATLLAQAGEPGKARAALLRADEHEPDHPAAQALRQHWRKEAGQLLAQAATTGDPAEKLKLQRRALELQPTLSEVQEEVLRAEKQYQILNIGVSSLPRLFSPALAASDSERWALDLIFESLLRSDLDPVRGQRYLPQLATALPQTTGELVQFRLNPAARWSTGERVQGVDVLQSARALVRDPVWGDLLELQPPAQHSLQIDFRQRLPCFDPWLVFTFRVLPRTAQGQLLNAHDEAFARAPVGSGPYLPRQKPLVEGERVQAVLTVNPHHQRGPQPYLRELRFFVSRNPVVDFADPRQPLHLLLNLSAERAALLRAAVLPDVLMPAPQRNQRVYFLAVNHRAQGGLLARFDLRLALSATIDRARLVEEEWRGRHPAYQQLGALGAGLGLATAPLRQHHQEAHRPLDSIFPPGSWPTGGTVTPLKYNPPQALAHLGKLKSVVTQPTTLTLRVPADDARASAACQRIAEEFNRLAREAQVQLTLRVEARSSGELRADLEKRTYDLAYHHLDHESASYWLGPLFDTRKAALDPGGSNYLGYQQDAELVSHFQTLLRHRDFHAVRATVQDIRTHLHDGLPLIPLWQIDTCLALHRDLHAEPLDPNRPLAHVPTWRLRGSGGAELRTK